MKRILLLLLIPAKLLAADCGESKWADLPKLENGLFSASRMVICKSVIDLNLDEIAINIRKDLWSSADKNVTEIEYNTYQVSEASDGVPIVSLLKLEQDKVSMVYSTSTIKVDDPVLKSIKTEIKFSTPNIMIMTVWIELDRPWYAPAPLFKNAAESKFVDKFEIIQNTFFKKLGL